MLKKNTMRWTCDVLVKTLAVDVLIYVYHEIAERKCSKD